MVVTPSGISGCPTQNIFEIVEISKSHTVTPDTLDSVLHVPSVTPDVAGTVSSIDLKSVACSNSDLDSCHSVVTQDPVLQSPVTPGIPEHIVPMLESAKEHLTEHQLQELSQLLSEFQDVFVKDEFDLGNFTVIEHSIQT